MLSDCQIRLPARGAGRLNHATRLVVDFGSRCTAMFPAEISKQVEAPGAFSFQSKCATAQTASTDPTFNPATSFQWSIVCISVAAFLEPFCSSFSLSTLRAGYELTHRRTWAAGRVTVARRLIRDHLFEFYGLCTCSPDKAGMKQAMATRPSFSSLDTQKKGSLTADDVKGNHWVSKNFSRCDTDQDGTLDRKEYTACK